jgi:hypothetical protein
MRKRWKSEEALTKSEPGIRGLNLVIVDIEWEFQDTEQVGGWVLTNRTLSRIKNHLRE